MLGDPDILQDIVFTFLRVEVVPLSEVVRGWLSLYLWYKRRLQIVHMVPVNIGKPGMVQNLLYGVGSKSLVVIHSQ